MPLSFRQLGNTFIAGPNITIYPSGNTFAISGSASGSTSGIDTISTIGSGTFSIVSSITNNNLVYRSLSGGSNFGIIDNGAGRLLFTATSPTTIISGVNASTGVTVFCGTTTINNTNDALSFYTLSASGDASIYLNSSDEIVVERGQLVLNTISNQGTGARIFSAITGNSLVQMTIISAATNSGFTASLTSPSAPDAGADSDATSFITAASITSSTQITAIQNLVFDLKQNNIWNKMQAIYPIVGGSENSHKYNLRDPRDLDAAFRLSFTTGWTHSASGATPNGTSAFANTFYQPSVAANQNSHHLSYYSRTDLNGTFVDIGSLQGTNGIFSGRRSFISPRDTNSAAFAINNRGTEFAQGSNTNSTGFYIANRTSTSLVNGWKNGTKLAENGTTAPSTTPPSATTYIGAWNSNGTAVFFSSRQCAFASIGSGLTDSDIATYYTIVEAYQTTLGRQIVASTVRSLGLNSRINISPSNTTADRFYITTTGPVLNINANYTTLAASNTMSIGGTAVATTRLLMAAGTAAISQIRLTPFSTEPTNPSDGSIWFSTSGNTLKLERGTNPSDFLFFDNNISLSGATSSSTQVLLVDTAGTISTKYVNSFGLFNVLSSVTIQNTAAETSIISSVLTGSTILLASTSLFNPELVVGKKFRFNAKGTIQTDTNNVDTLEVKIKLGSTTIGTTSAYTVHKNIPTDTYFEIDVTFTIRNSSIVSCNGKIFGTHNITRSPNLNLKGIYDQRQTITTTSDQVFDCTVKFDQADTNNIITINESTLEILN